MSQPTNQPNQPVTPSTFTRIWSFISTSLKDGFTFWKQFFASNEKKVSLVPARIWAITSVTGIIILCCACAAIAQMVPPTATNSTNQTVAKANNTPAPKSTQAPKATSNPKATNTPKPGPTAQQHFTDLAKTVTGEKNVTVEMDNGDNRNPIVLIVLGEMHDISAYQTTMKDDAFKIFQDFYHTEKGLNLVQVIVNFQGPIVDKYGNTSTGMFGHFLLTKVTADKFKWENLDYYMAFENKIYDEQMVRQS
jgi:hypothetical protein